MGKQRDARLVTAASARGRGCVLGPSLLPLFGSPGLSHSHPHPTASLGRGLPPRPPRFPFFCGDHSILSRPEEGCHVCQGPVTSCHSQTLRGLTSPGWPGPSRLSPDAHTPAPRPHSRSRWHACMPLQADSHTPSLAHSCWLRTRCPCSPQPGAARGQTAQPGQAAGKGPRASPEG